MDRKRILLVEDNDDHVLLMRRALGQLNEPYAVDVARDGAEAVDMLLPQDVPEGRDVLPLPDVVLLDLKLPKLHGFEVLRRLRAHKRTKLLPVVILTSSDEASDIARGYSEGANSYLCKPVDFNEFVELVRYVGTYWLSLNEPVRTQKGWSV